MISPRLLISVVGLALLFTAGGCAEVTLATAGTMAGIAATGISTGADVFRMGKLNSADMGSFAQWVDATRDAARDLGFTIEQESYYAPGKWRCSLADSRESHIRVYVERRTPALCRMRIDVGLLGSEPTARLLLARMRQHVPTSQPSLDPESDPLLPSK